MLIEFERRTNQLLSEIQSRKAQGKTRDYETERIRGQLEECERLRAFYVSQMLEKGRIIPEEGTY